MEKSKTNIVSILLIMHNLIENNIPQHVSFVFYDILMSFKCCSFIRCLLHKLKMKYWFGLPIRHNKMLIARKTRRSSVIESYVTLSTTLDTRILIFFFLLPTSYDSILLREIKDWPMFPRVIKLIIIAELKMNTASANI